MGLELAEIGMEVDETFGFSLDRRWQRPPAGGPEPLQAMRAVVKPGQPEGSQRIARGRANRWDQPLDHHRSREKTRRIMSDTIRTAVRENYAAVAQSGLSGGTAGVRAVAEAFGYSPEQLASVPADANLGVSCGNPTAFASLKTR